MPVIPKSSKSLSTATTHTAAGSAQSSKNGSSSLWMGRVLYGVCLLGVAALLGFFGYYFVHASQQRLAETQFESIAERALKSVESIATRKQSGTKTMAVVVGHAIPDATAYPFVTVPGFESMASSVLETAAIRELGFVPLVQEDQIEEFETFAYEYYDERFPYKNGTTALSPFGQGIWNTSPETGQRYHETSDPTSPSISNRTFLTPILQHDSGPHPALMLNIRGEPARARQMEDIMDCADERQQILLSQGDLLNNNIPCGAITDIVELRGQPPGTGPGAVVLEPIYPSNQPDQVTALLASTIVWDEILEDVFADTVSGIDCVLETTEGTVYSYQIQEGIAIPMDWKDLHDAKYNHFQRSTIINENQYTNNSPKYTLHLYPNDEFYQTYSSVNPIVATLAVVSIMVFTSLTFVIYDGCVRKEFASKKELLEARRRFVRFISHEVRTPLNSVCMGLSLMQEKHAKKVGFDNAELLTRYMEQEEEQQEQHEHEQQQSTTSSSASKLSPTSKPPPSASNNNSKQEPDPVTMEEFSLLSDLLSNAQSSVDVLNDFLNYDKIESGKLKLDLQVVNIRSLIESTTKEFRLSATKKQLQYNVIFHQDNNNKATTSNGDVEEGGGQSASSLSNSMALIGDHVRIKQVLRNLISNAIKFTPGGGKVEIRIQYIAPLGDKQKQRCDAFELKGGETNDFMFGGYIRVQVQDSGAGLTKQQLTKLFSEHIQFNPNDLQAGKGTGLGLFISKGIVEQHSGTLVASSEGLGHGSTFTVTLPLHQAGEAAAPGGDTAPDTSDDASVTARNNDDDDHHHHHHRHHHDQWHDDHQIERSSSNMDRSSKSAPASHRILIVDDALSNRKMMNRLLNHHGHVCDLAEDGQVAVRMVAEAAEQGEPYDTILMDYEMPVMNGPDATERIRVKGFDTFIVGVTGNMFPEDTERFLTSGANAVLPKPFKMNALDTLWAEYFLQNDLE